MGEGDRKRGAAFGRRCVLAAAVLWSLSGVITKSLPLDALTIAFYRSLFAGLALLPFVPPRRWSFRPSLLGCSLVFGAMTGLYLASIKATTAANAILLQYTAMFWMVPFSALILGERPDRRSLAGIALALLGIALIVVDGSRNRPVEGLGIAMGLASGIMFAGIAVGLRGQRDLDPVWLSAVNNLGGSLVLGAWILATTGPVAVPSLGQGVALVGFGVVQMAIPYVLFARGLREIGAPEAGLIGLVEPVLNPIWVVLVNNEWPAPATIVGGSLMLLGVACRYWPVGRIEEAEELP